MANGQPPQNPWKRSKLELLRDFIRFAIWVALAVIGGMASIFAVRFVYAFLMHAWAWCEKTLFSKPW